MIYKIGYEKDRMVREAFVDESVLDIVLTSLLRNGFFITGVWVVKHHPIRGPLVTMP